MSRLEIYYFTGTGNARQIAEWVLSSAAEYHIEAVLYNIAEHPAPTPASEALIIIIAPVHGFNYPPIVFNYIKNFPKGGNDIILMCTRAGLKLGRLITPGVTGVTFLLTSFMLQHKGYHIVNSIPFDMPSNWILLHPALKGKSAAYLYQVNQKRLQSCLPHILSGKRMNKWGLISCLLAPVAFAYDFYGRFILAKTLYATNDCMRCGICRHNCPVNAVSYKGNHPYWHLNCESCMRCVNACPQDAIQVGHLSIILTVMICLLLLYPLNSIWVKALGILLLPLPVQIIIYNSQHRLLKFKPIANLVKYTSLTFYKFWGRYKELLKKFKEVK